MLGPENVAHEPIDEILAELEPEPGPSGAGCARYDQVESQLLKNILARDGSLKIQAEKLAKHVKAEGTVKGYNGFLKKFQLFCETNSYDFENFTEQSLVHFVLDLEKTGPSLAAVGQIKPALTLLEKMRGRPISAFTHTVDMYLEAAKRRAADRRPPAVKAPELPADTWEQLVDKHVRPIWEGQKKADWIALRTILRVTVVKFTFCRFDCYDRLRANDFEDKEDGIKITFNSAKNDQLHQGNSSYIVNEEACRVIRYAFREFGFRMGDKLDNRHLNCVLVRKKGGWQINSKKNLSYSNATARLRQLLKDTGIDVPRATDKSFKQLGVTGTLEAGAELEDLMHQGRWRTLTMPLRYKLNSDKFKKDIAKKVV
jgi:hypothetical protein